MDPGLTPTLAPLGAIPNYNVQNDFSSEVLEELDHFTLGKEELGFVVFSEKQQLEPFLEELEPYHIGFNNISKISIMQQKYNLGSKHLL